MTVGVQAGPVYFDPIRNFSATSTVNNQPSAPPANPTLVPTFSDAVQQYDVYLYFGGGQLQHAPQCSLILCGLNLVSINVSSGSTVLLNSAWYETKPGDPLICRKRRV